MDIQLVLVTTLNKPKMAGAHWFQCIDEPNTRKDFDDEHANIGLANVNDIPYPALSKAIKPLTY